MDEYELGFEDGVARVTDTLEGFIKLWEDATGDTLDPLVAAQLAQHDTPPKIIAVLAELRWWRNNFRNKRLIQEVDYLIEYVRQCLLSLQKLIVQIPTALEPRPRDKRRQTEWLRTHKPMVKLNE